MESSLASLVSLDQLKTLAKAAQDIREERVGSVVYSSKACQQQWYVLISGKLRLNYEGGEQDQQEKSAQSHHEPALILKGEIFGGFDFFEDEAAAQHFQVEVLEPCHLVELKGEVLERIMDRDPDTATDIYEVLGEPTARQPAISPPLHR
jgi:CRP-like cAMP-binding protein